MASSSGLDPNIARFANISSSTNINGSNTIVKQFNFMDKFVLKMQGVFRADALKTTHPVHQDILHAEDTRKMFDYVVNGKASALFRMLENIVSEATFRKVKHNSILSTQLSLLLTWPKCNGDFTVYHIIKIHCHLHQTLCRAISK